MDAITSVKSPTQSVEPKKVQTPPPRAERSEANKPAQRAESGKPTATTGEAASVAKESKAASSESTRVTLSKQTEPQPNTADRNAKPIEQFKAVSALR